MSQTTEKPVDAPDAPTPAHLLAMIQELQSKCQQLEADKRTAGAEPEDISYLDTLQPCDLNASASEEASRLYQFRGAYGQIRVRNTRPTYQLRSPWVALGVKRYAVLSSADCHPADIAHMLQATVTVRRFEMDKYGAKSLVMEQQPLLVPIDAPA